MQKKLVQARTYRLMMVNRSVTDSIFIWDVQLKSVHWNEEKSPVIWHAHRLSQLLCFNHVCLKVEPSDNCWSFECLCMMLFFHFKVLIEMKTFNATNQFVLFDKENNSSCNQCRLRRQFTIIKTRQVWKGRSICILSMCERISFSSSSFSSENQNLLSLIWVAGLLNEKKNFSFFKSTNF